MTPQRPLSDDPFEYVGTALAHEFALLEALNRAAPDRCPDPSDTEREIWMKAGARRFVESLLAAAERARTEIRDNSTFQF